MGSASNSPGHLTDTLLAAALECFTAYGVRKTSLRDVAARAGVSRATAYRVFATKPDLLAAVVGSEVTRFIGEYTQAVDVTADGESILRKTVPFVLNYLRTHPVLARVLAEEPEQLLDLIIQRDDRPTAIEIMRPAAEAGITSAPEHLRARPEQIAEWSVRLLLSFFLVPRTTLDDTDQIADLLLYGVLRGTP